MNMKTKGIIVASVALTIGIGAIYFWLDRRESIKKINNKPEEPKLTYKDNDNNEQPGWKPKTPEALLRGLIQEILKENVWKNEREFLSTLSKRYVICAPEIGWLDYLPLNQEDLLECLNELGCLDEYEGELERRYRK
jgi:hypothetical protein